MKETDIAWLAGIIEGEGCIRAPKPGAKTVGIDIASTDRDVIEKVAFFMDCTFCIIVPKRLRWKTQYRITLTGSRAVTIMRLILPYMLSRRTAKIQEVLLYWDGRKTNSFKGKPTHWVDPELRAPMENKID